MDEQLSIFLDEELSNSTHDKARKLMKEGNFKLFSRHALDRTKSGMDYDRCAIKWVDAETDKHGNTMPVELENFGCRLS